MEQKWFALPPYRALLVVDVKDFSGLPGRHHAEVTDAIPEILRGAFERCGALEVWQDRGFGESTGDGHAVAFPSRVLPLLVGTFLWSLQNELDYRAQVGAHAAPLRMRASVTVGPITEPNAAGVSTGSGRTRVETHRLLDSEPVRDMLDRSGPDTRVAAVISGRAYEDAVLSGYAEDDEKMYVAASVQVKTFQGEAYLRVPLPTGDLLRHGFRPRDAEGTDPPSAEPGGGARPGGGGRIGDTTTYHVAGDNNVNSGSGNQFNGDGVRFHDRRRP